jgi:hypothetical protein
LISQIWHSKVFCFSCTTFMCVIRLSFLTNFWLQIWHSTGFGFLWTALIWSWRKQRSIMFRIRKSMKLNVY